MLANTGCFHEGMRPKRNTLLETKYIGKDNSLDDTKYVLCIYVHSSEHIG